MLEALLWQVAAEFYVFDGRLKQPPTTTSHVIGFRVYDFRKQVPLAGGSRGRTKAGSHCLVSAVKRFYCTQVGGQPVNSVEELISFVEQFQVGDQVPLTIHRYASRTAVDRLFKVMDVMVPLLREVKSY